MSDMHSAPASKSFRSNVNLQGRQSRREHIHSLLDAGRHAEAMKAGGVKALVTPATDKFDVQFARRVLQRNEEDTFQQEGVPELDKDITWEEVHHVLRHLSYGKAAGPDGVAPELLMHAGIGFEEALTVLFNFLWKNHVWPESWREAILVPLTLYKKQRDRLDPSNNRMIAIMSNIAKAFEKILDTRLRAWARRTGFLSDLQGGFREHRGTVVSTRC